MRRVLTEDRYSIPIYQRAYAWRDDEIRALLRDVRDARQRDVSYYIGSLVVYRPRVVFGEEPFEVVDGQQRLTTLTLLLNHPTARALLADEFAERTSSGLTFEGRERSTSDMVEVSRFPGEVFSSMPSRSLRDEGLAAGVETITTAFATGEVDEAVIRHLLDRVFIARTELPQETDLNHYFEVMNSRGAQLEKHEVVKTRLMRTLSQERSEDAETFALIWDACADLSRFVQAGVPKERRTAVFGESWDDFAPVDERALFDEISWQHEGDGHEETTLGEILRSVASQDPTTPVDESDETGRYGSIIDFPNFLLQTLKLHQGDKFSWVTDDDSAAVSLDDKRLLDQFARITTPDEVRRFAFVLLRTRFLFDNFVIKTDRLHDNSGDDTNWVLRRPHKTGQGGKEKLSPKETFGQEAEALPSGTQATVVILQSMFQVTDSRRAYKNFLHGILWELSQHDAVDINGRLLIAVLEELAADRARHLTTGGLDAGTGVQHFLFNYLDYLLWRGIEDGSIEKPSQVTLDGFRFRYRKSVEHFSPVHPDSKDGHDPLPHDVVNAFGNLCLMTQSENSRRNNLVATAKAVQFDSSRETLKFQLMAATTLERTSWGQVEIEEHGAEMKRLLSAQTVEPRA